MTKHKWYKEIVAWAGGATIECFYEGCWDLDSNPDWNDEDYKFRIKPKEPVYEYQFIYKIKGSDLFWITSFHYKSLENCSENSSHIPIEPYLPSKREVK